MNLQKKELKNGLKIISIPQKEALTSTVLVLVETGSKYETKEINGISHFLEHMCFKGTKKRPSALAISHELDSLGAQYNAFTAQEYTGFYAKVEPSHIDDAIDIISDIYLNQVFKTSEIKTERGVIIEEINMYEDNPRRKINDVFMNLLYGDQPAGWDIAGIKDIVKRLNRNDFLKYKNNHYVSSATTIILAGNFNNKILKSIEKKFSKIRNTEKKSKKITIEKQSSPQLVLKNKKYDQSHIMIGIRAFPIEDERAVTLRVLSAVLGAGMSSRLFQSIREKMGAAYYIYSSTDLYTDHGYLAVSVGARNSKANDVIKAIIKELKILKTTKVNPKELKKTKDFIIGNLVMGLESSDDMAVFYGLQEILERKLLTPKQMIDEIKKVTAEDILRLGGDIIQDCNLNLAIIGPKQDRGEIVKILKV